jgi:acyl-lipid omega-6 desaturase (Delta-12 desaturase)
MATPTVDFGADIGTILPKAETVRYSQRSYRKGIAFFILNVIFYASACSGAILFQPPLLKFVCSLFAGLFTALLFIVGHDACHHSLTPNKTLNYWLGQIAFLPALQPFSLWDLGHNRIHHRFTNLKTMDYVWTPLSLAEYKTLSASRRFLYRYYRSLVGPTLYYLVLWKQKMFLPSAQEINGYCFAYIRDTIIVCLYLITVTVALLRLPVLLPSALNIKDLTWWEPALYALCIPFLAWNVLMSFVIYLHHTHPEVVWFKDMAEWDAKRAPLECTVHVIFPGPINVIFHRIMEHTAHHIRPSIPLYHLKEAQATLEALHGARIVNLKWSIKNHVDIVARCKLYDYDNHCWLDFNGKPTTNSKSLS